MPTLQYGNSPIHYQLTRKELKRVAITVHADGSVAVTAPHEAPDDAILDLIHRRGDWILHKQDLVKERVQWTPNREWVSGEGIIYLGRQYRLKLIGSDVSLKAGILHAPSKNTASAIEAWFKAKAIHKFKERYKLISPKMPKLAQSVILGDQKTRWGSCDKKGVLRINWRVIMAPIKVVDYVIAHEMAHLVHYDHSHAFWKLVGTVLPDYESRKDWLRIHGASLKL